MEALRKTVNGYEYATLPKKQYAAPNTAPKRRSAPRQKLYKKIQVNYVLHPAHRAKRKNAFLNCAAILLSFALLSAVVTGYAQISSVNLENMKIQRNIDELEAQAEQLKLEIATKCGLQEVSEVAEKELSMGFPENSQIEYIQFRKVDTGNTADNLPQESWLSSVWDGLVGLLK